MPANPTQFPRKLAAALVLGLPALVLAWLVYPGTRPQDALARRWEAELVVLPHEELSVRMRQLADLGDAGLPVLARALHCDREETADAAFSALEIELVRWHALRKSESSNRAALLVRELARHAGSGGDSQRRAAASLAGKLLTWKGTVLGEARTQLAANCETVLGAATRLAPTESNSVGPLVRISRKSDAEEPSLEPMPDHELSSPVAPADVRVTTSTRRVVPEALEAEPAAKLPVRERSPRPFESSGARPLSPRQALGDMGDLALMRQLHDTEDAVQVGAERELLRRGYTALRLRVARQLTDPDPEVRRQLAEQLPQINGLDARPWLFWLSEDSDPEVRRAATSILATSTDPKVLARLRELRASEREE